MKPAAQSNNAPVQKECDIPGRSCYVIWRTLFEIDEKYVPIKAIGKGAYGVVCSAENTATREKVAIKKITNAFSHVMDARRTLREVKLLRHLKHVNVMAIRDIMQPVSLSSFNDLYVVSELMDTDLHQIIRSPQPLSDDHFQYFLYQVRLDWISEVLSGLLVSIGHCTHSVWPSLPSDGQQRLRPIGQSRLVCLISSDSQSKQQSLAAARRFCAVSSTFIVPTSFTET